MRRSITPAPIMCEKPAKPHHQMILLNQLFKHGQTTESESEEKTECVASTSCGASHMPRASGHHLFGAVVVMLLQFLPRLFCPLSFFGFATLNSPTSSVYQLLANFSHSRATLRGRHN